VKEALHQGDISDAAG